MNIVPSVRYTKDLKTLILKNPELKKKIYKTMVHIQKDNFGKGTRLHKIGVRKWSISVDMRIRILLYIESSTAYLLRIGTHEEVY